MRAEQLAADYLIRQGYLLLARNISNSRCEIDLVCLDKQFDELVFVEVKYRQNNNYGTAGLAVNQKKIRNMLSVAYDYLRKQQFKKNYRFDIIAVSGNLARARVEHFENITWL